MKDICLKLLALREKTQVETWTMGANLPFYVVMKKPRPSLSKHDDEQPTYWHCDDAYYVLTAAEYAGVMSTKILKALEELKDFTEWGLEDHVTDRLKEIINMLEETK